MTRDRDIKKSNFTAVTTFIAGDYLDLVRSGQNYRISFANFIASIGFTGTVESVGEVTAVPVYVLDGTDHTFRSIIGGSGIVASISSGNAVQLDHNFTIDNTGSPIMVNKTAVSPTLCSIVGGTGITVTAVGSTIEISLT